LGRFPVQVKFNLLSFGLTITRQLLEDALRGLVGIVPFLAHVIAHLEKRHGALTGLFVALLLGTVGAAVECVLDDLDAMAAYVFFGGR